MGVKYTITGKDIFTGKTYIGTCHSHQIVQIPVITRNKIQCIDIDNDGFCVLMDDDSNIREDIQVSEEYKVKIMTKMQKEDDIYLELTSTMNQEHITKIF